MNTMIGKPLDRVDGRLKVTGQAQYSAEFNIKNLAYGYTVQSTITKGRITNIDTSIAEKATGVKAVITHKNALKLQPLKSPDFTTGKLGEKDLLPLQGDEIFYNGQHIAIVVADTFEHAEYAATLIKVDYTEDKPIVDIENAGNIYQPKPGPDSEIQIKRGDAESAFNTGEVKVEEIYTTPVYHHNPMEPHATIAEYRGELLMLYDSTQSVMGSRGAIAQVLGMPVEKVRLVSYYLGGGFGCKGFTWAHSIMAPMAAKHVGHPVKIVLDRQQMFTVVGRRSTTSQKISLAADNTGKLTSVLHNTTSETSFVDEFIEQAGVSTKILYNTENLGISQNIAKLNRGTPCPTRAPGEAPGSFAFEVAMDELAEKLKMDPVQLRLINYADKDPQSGHQWSEKNLKDCYQRGAEAIGWSNRKAEPKTNMVGDYLVGYGMATATYPANRSASSAKIQVYPDGHAVILCATQDIGTGTYTILIQIASDATGIPVDKFVCKLGDTSFPKSPGSGGSQTAASAGSAVWAAGLTLKSKAIKMAIGDNVSPLYKQQENTVTADNGRLFLTDNLQKGETYQDLMKRKRLSVLEAEVTTDVSTRKQKDDTSKKDTSGKDQQSEAVKQDEDIDRTNYSFHSFGAQFVKVLIDPVTGTVKVGECAAVMDIGKVLNMKTAQNQIMGGIIWGMGMALMEETVYDPITGRIVTRDLSNYLVPVNADMPAFNIQFIDTPDPVISPVGARGIGEIGITGITAAIVNAIYNATGKRIRNLPVTPDKLI